jgi:hypothetical protein
VESLVWRGRTLRNELAIGRPRSKSYAAIGYPSDARLTTGELLREMASNVRDAVSVAPAFDDEPFSDVVEACEKKQWAVAASTLDELLDPSNEYAWTAKMERAIRSFQTYVSFGEMRDNVVREYEEKLEQLKKEQGWVTSGNDDFDASEEHSNLGWEMRDILDEIRNTVYRLIVERRLSGVHLVGALKTITKDFSSKAEAVAYLPQLKVMDIMDDANAASLAEYESDEDVPDEAVLFEAQQSVRLKRYVKRKNAAGVWVLEEPYY